MRLLYRARRGVRRVHDFENRRFFTRWLTKEPHAAKPRRRVFTAEYKKRILEEANAATEKGAIGALMRRDRLWE